MAERMRKVLENRAVLSVLGIKSTVLCVRRADAEGAGEQGGAGRGADEEAGRGAEGGQDSGRGGGQGTEDGLFTRTFGTAPTWP